MAILIGHASISEKGTINGTKGDQTGKEVCTRKWYDKDWNGILRPKKKELAEKSAKACEAGCANKNIGYGQGTRNSAYFSYQKVRDMSKIEPSNTDCSAYMTLCAIAGGCTKLNYTDNAPTTFTMIDKFVATGDYEWLTDSKYTKSDEYLKRGDILVKKACHTVMALENGSKVKSTTVTKVVKKTNPYTEPSITIKQGSKGDGVKWVQYELNEAGYTLEVDGDFGKLTLAAVKTYQKANKLEVDGKVGKLTRASLKNN